MKTMIFTDLITMKNSLLTLLGLNIVIGLFLVFSMESLLGGLAAMVTIIPFIYLFSISAYDDMGGWERFRMTLPLTRRQVVFGRYASLAIVLLAAMLLTLVVAHIIVNVAALMPNPPDYLTSYEAGFYSVACVVATGAAIVLLTATISLPFIMRFGMTKATRILPVVIVVVLALGIAVFDNGGMNPIFSYLSGNMLDWGADTVKLGIAVAIVLLIALYLASACIAAKLYEGREL